PLIGKRIHTVPVWLRWDPADPLNDTLRRSQAEHRDLMPYQHVGLSDIQRLAGQGELFDTYVAFENFPFDLGALQKLAGDLRIDGFAGLDATHYPPYLVAHVDEGRLRLALNYRPDLFDRAAVTTIGARLVALLETVIEAPERPVGRIDLLTADERRTLATWQDTGPAVPAATFPDLFAAQVARTPDAVAVESDEVALTYAELDRRADRLARHLAALGVGPEQVVALMLGRSVESVVASLAVMRAGAAYLPIDPDYPAERITFMLTDARPAAVLTVPSLA